MSLPPYIPGAVAIVLATGAALSQLPLPTPDQLGGMSEVVFLRWLLVAMTGGGGWLLYRILSLLERQEARQNVAAESRDQLILTAAKEAMKPEQHAQNT